MAPCLEGFLRISGELRPFQSKL